MGSKNNVWVVKLIPSGGLLTEQKKRLDDAEEIRGKFDKDELNEYKKIYGNKEISDWCIKKGIVAIGWTLSPKDSWLSSKGDDLRSNNIDITKYNKLRKEQNWDRGGPSYIEKFQEIKIGDICWIRNSKDIYYACKITGNWTYDNTKESWAMDIAQRYPCTPIKVGDATEAPSEIVKKLITRGNTVIKIEDKTVIDISNYLFENGGEKAVKKAVSEFNEGGYIAGNISIIDNLTQYEYEDFVGFYLQKKGYFIMPSTRYQSTEGYEFVAIKQNEKMVVQAKYHKEKSEKLDAKEKKYENLSKTYTVYLACNNGINNIDNDNNKIKQVESSELEKFIRENPFLIPDRVKFLVVYTRNHKQV